VNRQELVDKLELVSPALSSIDLVPVLTHFWFKDGLVLAYNDQIAISTKLSANFAGAVPGKTLKSLLSVSKAKEVEFFVDKDSDSKKLPEGQLLVKAASSKLKLPFLAEEQTKIFDMPKPDPKGALPVDINSFLEAISSCMRSLKEDTAMPDSLGITFSLENDWINLYATNDATISFAKVKVKSHATSYRIVLSGNFCRQMAALSKLEGKKHIEIHKDYSLFQCGEHVLFGKLIEVQRPLDFDSVLEQSFPQEVKNNLVSIPSKLELILDRAVVITDSKADRAKTAITVKDGIAKFLSQSDKGEVRDSVQLEDAHPDVEVNVDPKLFKNGFGYFDKFVLTEQCLIMSTGSSLYLVSASH
jgi:DNA polymerase III sliding clamp (beta) subunit (PCNA family)